MQRTDLVLRAADLELALAPGIGGAIASFRQGGFALMRETSPDEQDVRNFSCYPLVPFSNRIGQGKFSFENRSYRIKRDGPTGQHAIHGEGLHHAWDVAEAGETSARLVMEHDATAPESWPFPFRAEQHFQLTASGFEVIFTLTNQAKTRAPAGIGLHPYFPRHGAVMLGFRAGRVWQNGADHLPSDAIELPAEWDFSSPHLLAEPGLDNCFAGWSGRAEIAWPKAQKSLRISADRCFGHAVVYTPVGREYFAFEPVSHMNDAINRREVPGNGLVVLEAGGSLSGTVRFEVASSRNER